MGGAVSDPAVQDASWLSYSRRTVTVRGVGGGGGGWGECGDEGMRMGCGKSTGMGGAVSAPAVQDASWLSYSCRTVAVTVYVYRIKILVHRCTANRYAALGVTHSSVQLW